MARRPNRYTEARLYLAGGSVGLMLILWSAFAAKDQFGSPETTESSTSDAQVAVVTTLAAQPTPAAIATTSVAATAAPAAADETAVVEATAAPTPAPTAAPTASPQVQTRSKGS